MKNVVAIDVGNTNITVGIFKAGHLAAKRKISTHTYALYESSLKKAFRSAGLSLSGTSEVIISSVVPIALARLIMHLNKITRCNITILGRDMDVPINNLYRIKNEVGQDRLVNAYAAKLIYGAPALVVDFGTAITFDLISASGGYLGGLILPGIGISLSSLYEKTALLPKVELKAASHIIGRDTVSSMRGGILFGFGAMCDGLVAQYKKILGKSTKVIATGGNSKLVKRYAKSIQHVDEDITLKGLQLISKV